MHHQALVVSTTTKQEQQGSQDTQPHVMTADALQVTGPKRGRPKGAAAYPETAVCIKCKVFRPKRRGFCDRCRPRNRSSAKAAAAAAAAAIAGGVTSNGARPGSATSHGMPTLRPMPSSAPSSPTHAISAANTATNAEQNIKLGGKNKRSMLQREDEGEEEQHSVAASSAKNKRRRTTSAPSPLKEKAVNRNVDIVPRSGIAASGSSSTTTTTTTPVQVNAAGGHLGCIPAAAPASAIDSAALLATLASTHPAFHMPGPQHQLAFLVPRLDGSGVDIVPLQFLAPHLSAGSMSHAAAAMAPGGFYLHSLAPPPSMTMGVCNSPPAERSNPLINSTSPAAAAASLSSVIAAHNLLALAGAGSPLTLSPNHPSTPAVCSPFSSPSSSFGRVQSFTPPSSPASSPALQAVSGKMHLDGVRSKSEERLPSLGSLELPRPYLPANFRTTCNPPSTSQATSRPTFHAAQRS